MLVVECHPTLPPTCFVVLGRRIIATPQPFATSSKEVRDERSVKMTIFLVIFRNNTPYSLIYLMCGLRAPIARHRNARKRVLHTQQKFTERKTKISEFTQTICAAWRKYLKTHVPVAISKMVYPPSNFKPYF